MTSAKQKLVVIGNGMAGARLVEEEVLARRGGDLFDTDGERRNEKQLVGGRLHTEFSPCYVQFGCQPLGALTRKSGIKFRELERFRSSLHRLGAFELRGPHPSFGHPDSISCGLRFTFRSPDCHFTLKPGLTPRRPRHPCRCRRYTATALPDGTPSTR